jgi:hypothetical protein
MTRIIRILLATLLIGSIFIIGNTACSAKGSSTCARENSYKKPKAYKNHNKYGSQYGTKQRPVKKDYVIRNKRSGKKY